MALIYEIGKIAFMGIVFEPAVGDHDMAPLIRAYAERFPTLAPQRYGRTGNSREFDSRNPHLTKAMLTGGWGWERSTPESNGTWYRDHDGSGAPSPNGRGDILSIDVGLKQFSFDMLPSVLEWWCTTRSVAIAYLHVLSQREGEYGRGRRLAQPADRAGKYWGYNAWDNWKMAFGIPDLAYVTVLGPTYTKLIGQKRILGIPAPAAVHEIAKDTFCIRLTDNYCDIERNWDRFDASRKNVRSHLGEKYFNGTEPAAKEHVPVGLWPLRHLMERNASAKPPKPPEITTLEEVLADTTRFKITALKGELVLVDTARSEAVAQTEQWRHEHRFEQLAAAGVPVTDKARAPEVQW